MRGLRAVAMLAVALGGALGGCATPVEPVPWQFGVDPHQGARLTLGAPESGDLTILAECQPHSGAIRLTIFAHRDDPPIVELHSGKLWNRYGGGGVHYDEESQGGSELQFELNADDPVLARVADTGELTLKLGQRWLVPPNGFAQQHDFIMACRSR